ncbi:MAG: acyltransferase [Pirellulales bacterium]
MGILRFFLAVSVVAHHSGDILCLKWMPGNFAVEIFFIISGFYMALVLSEKYSGKGRFVSFYKNRFLRLYPTFLVITLATWAWFFFVWWWLKRIPTNGWVEQYGLMGTAPKVLLVLSNWLMIGNDARCLFHFSHDGQFKIFHAYGTTVASDGATWCGDFGTIGQAWSIGLEIWFYLLAPILSKQRTRVLVSIAVCSVVLKISMETNGFLSYFFFPAQLYYFIAGMITQRLGTRLKNESTTKRVGVLLCLIFALVTVGFQIIPISWWTWARLVICGAICISLPYIFCAFSSSRFDRWIGNLSYPIYMTHMLVISILTPVMGVWYSPNWALVCSFAGAMLIYYTIEKPIDHLRQSLASKQRATQNFCS